MVFQVSYKANLVSRAFCVFLIVGETKGPGNEVDIPYIDIYPFSGS